MFVIFALEDHGYFYFAAGLLALEQFTHAFPSNKIVA